MMDKPVVNKKNVMNRIHNVTIASPPTSAGKERSASTSDIKEDTVKALNHSRTRTRTIEAKDSFLHTQQLFKAVQAKPTAPVKEPVSFEIKFSDPKSVSIEPKEEEDYNYESDFESYESDFEPEVPSTSASAEKLEESTDDEVVDLEAVDKTNQAAKIDKERIDSGSFEMSTLRKPVTSPVHYDSIDDTINSHDSGISYDDLNIQNKQQAQSQKVLDFYKRGEELMKKITLDELNFNIFEAKPIPYETFMWLYGGQVNTFQVSTQSESTMTVDEVQTDPIMKSEVWTQYPAKFTRSGLEQINSKLYNEEKLGVGEGTIEQHSSKDDLEDLSSYIDAINNFSKTDGSIVNITKMTTTFDSLALQKFVENAAFTISNVIDNQVKQQELKQSKISISRGYTTLKFSENEILRNTSIKKLYTNLKVHNFIVTIHKTNSQQNLICLWDVLNNKRPMKIFSSWSDVKCIEIHAQESDIIIGGCNDGTISLWDIQEFVEWKDEDEIATIVKPFEIISLNQMSNNFALDNVVALRSLPHREYKSTSSMFSQSQAAQICSLHRNGSIIIWTISRLQSESLASDLQYTHIKSRAKLLRNVVIELNSPKIEMKDNVKRKSAFEKTRYYFENDLFSDKVLRELQEIDSSRLSKAKNVSSDEELTKFIDCAVNLYEIYVASDLNYISAVARLNLGDETRKIVTNESSFVSPTAVAVHPINSNVLAVGQTNGELKFIKVHEDEMRSSSKLKSSRKSTDATGTNDLLSKSCAFQNIVENEKKFYDETQALNNLESDELNLFLVNEAFTEQLYDNEFVRGKLKVPFDKNIFNSFEVSSGPITVLTFNKTGEFLFVVIGKRLKIFNCWLNAEVDHQEKLSICDLKCVQGADSFEYLVRSLQTS